MHAALPVTEELKRDAKHHKVELVLLPTAQAIEALKKEDLHKTNALLHSPAGAAGAGSLRRCGLPWVPALGPVGPPGSGRRDHALAPWLRLVALVAARASLVSLSLRA
jgi:hypothetical protein